MTTTLENPVSMMCCAAHFHEDAYVRWSRQLQLPEKMHRKYWEYVYVARVLELHGMLAEGKRGLGFAVGKEPLPLAFAEMGAQILMTDFAPAGWKKLAATKAPPQPNLSFRKVDMTNIPENLTGFDFLWSCCAFEHLGSAGPGLAFVRKAMRCLKPGGVAVHTTEFNISSNRKTNDNCASVLYRRCDLEKLWYGLRDDGNSMAELNWFSGDEPSDWDIGHLDEESGYLKRMVIPIGDKQLRVRTTPKHRRIAAPMGYIGTSFGFYVLARS